MEFIYIPSSLLYEWKITKHGQTITCHAQHKTGDKNQYSYTLVTHFYDKEER